LKDNRGRDIRHDSQAEDRDLRKLAGAERGNLIEHGPQAAIATEFLFHRALVDDGQRDLPTDSIDRQEHQGQKNLLTQLRDRENDANFLQHGLIRPSSTDWRKKSPARPWRVAA